MKLIDALEIIRAGRGRSSERTFALATGFTPLHLATFLTAHLQRRLAQDRAGLSTGVFGDLVGNVRRLAAASPAGLAVVVEWPDADARLGYRQNGGWGPAALPDILQGARGTLARLAAEVTAAGERTPVVVSLPTLPLPPVAFTTPGQASGFELQLRLELAQFAATLAGTPGVTIVSAQQLDAASPIAGRLSVKGDLATGLPYAQPHADAVAEACATLLLPATPKKGLITDLDDTVWLGILGDVGVDGVAWDLEHHAQVHGMYQQLVASLAESGVLVAIASKNDESLVEEAFRRRTPLLPRDAVFPLLASWGAKSKAVDAVLHAWNVGPDSLVFVDDSPIELAEVQARFPQVECRLFPKNDPDAVLALLRELRELFGRPALQAEDALRRESLRNAEAFRQSAAGGHDEESFLSGLDATVTFTTGQDAADARAFELINKTNQFNLNGRRYLDADWKALRVRSDAALVTVSYQDKFGALGKIAVLTGIVEDGRVQVERWVMSCRAFARRIEHATLRALFDQLDVDEVVLDYEPTARNTPTREFLATLGPLPEGAAPITITRAEFDRVCPPLYHRTERSALSETA
jgi:FkbH-like protein